MADLKPKFGDRMRGTYASVKNPQRDGFYVRTIRRRGKMNAGTFYELTDGAGNFWEYPVESTIMRDTRTEAPLREALEKIARHADAILSGRGAPRYQARQIKRLAALNTESQEG